MNRSEFINWLETDSGLSRETDSNDDYWKELMNYAEYIWDELEVKEDSVVFMWEEWEWGGINYRKEEYTFDEFVERYKSDSLK
jgi:hypothetical protein